MITFSQTKVAITRTGTLNNITVEFTTVDGSPEVSGAFRDAENNTVGSFNFSQSNKSVNIHKDDVSAVDTTSIWGLIADVDAFIASQE